MVEFFDIVLHDRLQFRQRHTLKRSRVVVGVYQRDKFAVVLHHERLCHIWHIVELLLYLFRVDILPGRPEYHALVASADIYVAIGVNRHYIAGIHPAVFVEYRCRGIIVVEVSLHHVGAFYPQHAGHIGRVGRVYAHLHTAHGSSARTGPLLIPRRVGNQRATFRHAVAHGIGEPYATQKSLNIFAQACSAYYEFLKAATECFFDACFNPCEKLVVHKRYVQQHLHERLVEQREHTCLHNLLYDKWY